MATSFEQRALVEQLRALTQKRAENPGEQALTTSHPSGSNSSADDHTSPAVVGSRYAENSADNKAMYPKGPDTAAALQAGSQQKDPGHNKGVKVRPTGEMPEVERKYNLGDHNDPGTSHPSGKAAESFIAEARGLAAELRNLIKASEGKADTYVTGNVPDKATDDTNDNASGTSAYPPNADNDGNIPLTKEQGKNAAAELYELRQAATRDLVSMRDSMKESAAVDAESFVAAVTTIMNKFAAPHVLPVLQAEAAKEAQANKQAQADAIKQAEMNEIDALVTKVAVYNLLAERDGEPKLASLAAAKTTKSSKKAKYLRKKAEELMEEAAEEEASDSEEEVVDDEEAAAEEALAQMASTPDGGGAPDEAAAMDPAAAMAAEGGEPQLSPEDEAALMALMQQEGMKESDVKSFAKVASLIAAGKIDPAKLSSAQVAFIQTCDGAVKRAGAKFQTLRSAGRLRNELNTIYKGI